MMTEESKEAQEPVVEEQVQQVEEVQQEQPKNDVDHNWKQANEILRLQQMKIEQLEARLTQREQPIPEPEEEISLKTLGLEKDDYLTAEKALQIAEKISEKKSEKKAVEAAKKIVQEYTLKNQIELEEMKLRSKHDDYDYVVENFAIPLIKNDPALAYKVQNSKNPAETAYRLGKLSDNYEEVMKKQAVNPKAEKILKNASRPVSANALGNPLQTQAENYSKMSPKDVWEMSQKYAKTV